MFGAHPRSSLHLLAALILSAVATTSGCRWFDCPDAAADAVTASAPEDLDCKQGDITFGYLESGASDFVAEGCGRAAYYRCSSARETCASCSLQRVVQY